MTKTNLPYSHAYSIAKLVIVWLLQSKVHKPFRLYNFVTFWIFPENSCTDLPRILRRIRIQSQNKQGVNT